MKPIEAVTGVTIGLLLLVSAVFMTVMLVPGFTADQRTMVITAAVGAVGVIGGYWLNSSADAAKKADPVPGQSTTTTTTTSEAK